MRNITAQYRSLLEGKMSKANFMTNVRRTFPDYISATNSFEDAIKILKNKRILSEGIHDRDITSASHTNIKGQMGDYNPKAAADRLAKLSKFGPKSKHSDDEFADMEKRHEMEKGAEDAKLGQYDENQGLEEIFKPEQGEVYTWTMGAEPMEITYIGKTEANPTIKVGSRVGKGHIFKFKDGRFVEVGPATMMKYIEKTEHDDMEERHKIDTAVARGLQHYIPEAKSSKKHKPDTKEEISEKEVKAKLESKHDGKQLEAALKVFRKIDISKFKTVGEAVKEIEANAKKQFPAAFESDEEPKGKKSLKEATEKSEGSYKKVTGKDQYEVFSEIDRVNPYELRKGITMEMGMQYLPTPNSFTEHFNPDTLAKATRKALKNLQEDPAYYTNKISEPTEKRTNMHQKPKELKVGPDGGAKVKGFTAAKSNTQTNLGKKEKGSKSPDGVKVMKPSKGPMGGVKVMKSNEKLPKGVQLMEGSIERETQKEIDKILQKSKKKPEEGGYPATKTGVYQGPKKITDPILSPAALKKAKKDTEAAKLKKLEEYIMAEVKKALKEPGMKEGAVAQTVTGATVASGKNQGDVIKKAKELEQQTGDQITVVDTKTGAKKDA